MQSLIEVYLINLFSLIFFWGSGNLFHTFFLKSDEILIKQNIIDEIIKIFLGFFFTSVLLIFINFFMPLYPNFNLIIFLLVIIFSFKSLKIVFYKKFIFFLILTSALSTLFLFKSNNFMPDAGLYHLPFTKIINNEKIIFGLTNLHSRFGHISIIQYLNAFMFNPIFGEKGIIIIPALISSVFINFLILKIFCFKKFNITYFICFLSLAFSATYLDRYSNYGNDAAAFIFAILSIIFFTEYYYDKKTNSKFFLISIFTIFGFLTKSFLIILLVIPLILILNRNFKKFILTKTSFFLILTILFWSIKTVINSGCIIYPISKSCFYKFSWLDIEKTKYLEEAGEANAKAFLDLPKIDKNISDKISYRDFNKNFNWIKAWSKVHMLKIFEILYPYLLFLIIYFSYIIFSSNVKRRVQFKNNYILLNLLIITFFILWFIKFPLFRFGVPFIFLMISTIFLSTISLEFDNHKLLKINKFLVCIFLSVILLINFNRISNNFANPDFPKIVKSGETNYNKKYYNNNFFYTRAFHLCMYNTNLCTHLNTNMYLKIINNYKFFIPLN